MSTAGQKRVSVCVEKAWRDFRISFKLSRATSGALKVDFLHIRLFLLAGDPCTQMALMQEQFLEMTGLCLA